MEGHITENHGVWILEWSIFKKGAIHGMELAWGFRHSCFGGDRPGGSHETECRHGEKSLAEH